METRRILTTELKLFWLSVNPHMDQSLMLSQHSNKMTGV